MLNILMVDDEPDLDLLIQQRFRQDIKAHRLSFTFARHGTQALTILAGDKAFDLVVTDLNMPEMNGIELLLQVKKHYPNVKMLVISAYSDQENIRMATNAGADGFLFKPLNFQEFEEKIHTCCG
jgi:sigma-B regulation protein RsbU (phosphoserine phosphatase)